MNYQINIPLMKKKTEIEDKLLSNINKNFQEYLSDIEYIKNNFTQINFVSNSKKYSNINDLFLLDQSIQDKLFSHPNTIYSIFQIFYLKRTDYMGMNLTGLIQGKMETGLGFRTSIIKSSLLEIKDNELSDIVNKYLSLTNKENVNIYKITFNGFKWNEDLPAYTYFYIIADLTSSKYFFLLEK
jgi:hypothetical protein